MRLYNYSTTAALLVLVFVLHYGGADGYVSHDDDKKGIDKHRQPTKERIEDGSWIMDHPTILHFIFAVQMFSLTR